MATKRTTKTRRGIPPLRKLKAKQRLARKTLARLGRQSAAASGPLKAGARRAWRHLGTAMREATRRFRDTT